MNGFFLKFASGALGTDSSGKGNTFTVSGTMTNTKDTPENNFATINPLRPNSLSANFMQMVILLLQEQVQQWSGEWHYGFTKGKWYWDESLIDDVRWNIT